VQKGARWGGTRLSWSIWGVWHAWGAAKKHIRCREEPAHFTAFNQRCLMLMDLQGVSISRCLKSQASRGGAVGLWFFGEKGWGPHTISKWHVRTYAGGGLVATAFSLILCLVEGRVKGGAMPSLKEIRSTDLFTSPHAFENGKRGRKVLVS